MKTLLKTLSNLFNFAAWPLPRKLTLSLLVPILSGVGLVLLSLNRFQRDVPGADLDSAVINRFLIELLAVLLPGVLLTGVLWLLLNVYIVRQLNRLSAGIQRLAEGNFNQPIQIAAGDELGRLSETVNQLSTQLQRDFRDLEQSIAQRTRDVEATRDIGQILSSLRDVDQLSNEVIRLILSRFESIYHAQVFLLDERRIDAVLRASTGEVGKELLALGHRLGVGSQSVIGQVTARGEPVIALDTTSSVVHKVNELLPETRAECALPLQIGGSIIGALDLQSKQPDAFTEADIRLFQAVADQLAIAIQNARLFEDSQARVREIEELNRLLIGDAWRDYIETRRRGKPNIAANTGSGLSQLQQQAISTNQLAEHLDGERVQFAVPIRLREQVLGAIEWEVPQTTYTENARLLATELAAQLALAADNARLLEQSQRLAQRERLINDISNKLTQQTDVSQILQTAVKELGQALQVAQTSIQLTGEISHEQP